MFDIFSWLFDLVRNLRAKPLDSSWYYEGYNAFYNNKDECPYDELSESYNEWSEGWTAAQTEYEEGY